MIQASADLLKAHQLSLSSQTSKLMQCKKWALDGGYEKGDTLALQHHMWLCSIVQLRCIRLYGPSQCYKLECLATAATTASGKEARVIRVEL